ncbi:alpha/beta fold hydrolase [Paraflavitalea pollutisoli]|uniref:alpha/beta hydrolase family protein n=1 Tax=Paraflavitalea pollutisoli TaxID=3034143 RepID=UPI0023EBAF66|nr:alpha/beta fold hydrolase [Paraflavitalea sp. H1-2-19X]
MHENGTIRTKDGCAIGMKIYAHAPTQGKVILVGPSVLASQQHYHELAIFLESQGYPVITFDYRGVGLSAPQTLKGFKARLLQWAVQDLDAVIRYARTRFPNQEIIYIGHGISGELIGLSPANQYINKLVLVNSALTCRKLWPWHDRLRMLFLKTFVRLSSTIMGYFPGRSSGISDNLPKGVMYEWIDWCSNNNGLFDHFPDINYRKLDIPLLAISFSDDWRSPREAVQALLHYFSGSQITWHHFKPGDVGMKKIGHLGPFEKRNREGIWNPMLVWLRN